MNKTEKYSLLIEQIRALIEGETDSVAVMANVCAAVFGRNQQDVNDRSTLERITELQPGEI